MSSIITKIWNINFEQMYMTPTISFKKMVQLSSQTSKPIYPMTEYCLYLAYKNGNICAWQQIGRTGPFNWRIVFDEGSDMQKEMNSLYENWIAEKYILGAK